MVTPMSKLWSTRPILTKTLPLELDQKPGTLSNQMLASGVKKWDEKPKMEARKMFYHLIREVKVPGKEALLEWESTLGSALMLSIWLEASAKAIS